MLPTYPAILRDGSLVWGEGGPPPLPAGDVPVHVTFLVPPTPSAGGPAMAAALEALAASGVASVFGDPCEWQRESRSADFGRRDAGVVPPVDRLVAQTPIDG